ncbi:hypothetical protein Ahy_A06g030497 isoform A [Arachis hypogaea]|uniref:Uncharacterized protein n=1 Tax=Arachis hypogaea TaxID=3818 RepID=A0A445CWG1_ARAHY|nr:hypothetical protein Ahy_A06g030497 isoform A [Arachis hypogaea]
MVVEENNSNNNNGGWAPIGSPMNVNVHSRNDSHWTNFESSVNAVFFGFVATAILISMFLLMAIFERFLRPTTPMNSPLLLAGLPLILSPRWPFPASLATLHLKGVGKAFNFCFFYAKSAFFPEEC